MYLGHKLTISHGNFIEFLDRLIFRTIVEEDESIKKVLDAVLEDLTKLVEINDT